MPTRTPPAFNALLFGLSGCLVDFGARTLPVALTRTLPRCAPERLQEAATLPPTQALGHALQRPAKAAELARFAEALASAADEHAEAAPGLDQLLDLLATRQIPGAWLDELPEGTTHALSSPLASTLAAGNDPDCRPWPAPDACWSALASLGVDRLEGCVLVSGEPRLIQAGLNAGLWTVGLATSGRLCGQALGDWQALPSSERDPLRARATLELYRLGAHSVIDHLGELPACLDDLAARRQKGEKP
ncbi:HAD family phosphatase [Pseudomonas tohonis]|uniref:HAD family phosphatase n=2 Tax=Pseudomonas tohonis TaxID=2725477 RepID=UPI001F2B827F|nr:HAD family phosphatase [Pseudomonas tohonis]